MRRHQRTERRIAPPRLALAEEAQQALQLFEGAEEPVFLTGRAGTGKSTLLQYFRATTKKKVVVLAPTGVAAVNVRGQTIHSFFGFSPDITPEKVRERHERERALYKSLDAIVIDEISMVRADLLDCIDAFLRRNGRSDRLPFGGVKMIFIGDLYQLPPVVPSEEAALFSSVYPSPYFFDARALRRCGLHVVELTRVYRQRDTAFIAVLDAIRTAGVSPQALALLNTRYTRAPLADERAIHLVPTNAQADRINSDRLARLPGQETVWRGEITGAFARAHLPTGELLSLKPGARIMMCANDQEGRWINGDIGVIRSIDPGRQGGDAITVALENGRYSRVARYTWEVIRFSYDAAQDRIVTETIGAFTQYPLRLAWALTIHKAQGKTFERIIVDFGRGTFAHGQAYVALSRSTSLEGLVLRTPVEPRHLFIDRRVREFFARVETAAPPAPPPVS
jgi:ATP-dependent exoDNAse (exonuclease V) alpha subunit